LQQLSLNSLVLSDADRATITDGAAAKLAASIPRPNFVDSSGTRFIGSALGPVNNDQWGPDINHILTGSDRLHGYYSFNLSKIVDPNYFVNTVPGFGHTYLGHRQFFSLNETHTLGPEPYRRCAIRSQSTTRLEQAECPTRPGGFRHPKRDYATDRPAANRHCRRRAELWRSVEPSNETG
jgi:hypothetical protein